MIPEQVEDLALVGWQSFHLLVKLAPLGQFAGVQCRLRCSEDRAIAWVFAGVVMSTVSLRPVVVASQVDEFTANVEGGQVQEVCTDSGVVSFNALWSRTAAF